MSEFDKSLWESRLELWALLLLLGLICLILRPFWGPILWATVLGILLGPSHRRLLLLVPAYPNAASLLTVVVFGALILAPLVWVLVELQAEAAWVYHKLPADLEWDQILLPQQLADVPLLGPWLQTILSSIPTGTHALLLELKGHLPLLGQAVGRLVRECASQIFQWVATAICLFFFLKHATAILSAIRGLIGPRAEADFRAIRAAVFAVSLGFFGGAMAQGVIAALGFALMGIETPLLLGLVAALAALVPVVGASLVWGPIVIGMLHEHRFTAALGLALWGMLVIHPADNLIRPWVISHVLHLPMLLVLFGVVGGVLAFGLVGAFIGPVILSLGMRLWLQWVGPSAGQEASHR